MHIAPSVPCKSILSSCCLETLRTNIEINRGDKVDELEDVSEKSFKTNVVGNIHLFNLFLPLVKKGKVKKVIAISSGHADLDLINDLEFEVSALYAAAKAALNIVVAKFNAQYKKEGILFVSISPGVVDVGHFDNGIYPLCDKINTWTHY